MQLVSCIHAAQKIFIRETLIFIPQPFITSLKINEAAIFGLSAHATNKFGQVPVLDSGVQQV